MNKPNVPHPVERLAASGVLRPMPPMRRRRRLLDVPALVLLGLALAACGLAALAFACLP